MFPILDSNVRLCDGFTRREWLRVGGLSCLGLSLPNLLAAAPASQSNTFGRAKSCIILFLAGGPPQHETFDPKPDAAAEIRGEFRPIATNIPGVQFCELLPRTARMADRLAIIRSMSTNENAHSASSYWMTTGYPSPIRGADFPPRPDDWPCIASIVQKFRPSDRLPFSSVVVPEPVVNNPNIPFPGQNGGLMGRSWDPQFFRCDPTAADFKMDSLGLPGDVPALRLAGRRSLLHEVDRHVAAIERFGATDNYGRFARQAFDVLASNIARNAFDLGREKKQARERYGRHKFGQSVLLARRLIEAGVRLVHVNWPREPGDGSSGNPLWDTHMDNAGRLKDVLCPPFDVALTALLEDLEVRGLLAETLVVVMGEFGRTPRINFRGGRDHWGHVFSVALAGAGIRAAQVYGSSDRNGAYPATNPVQPQDLTATIYHLLGIRHDTEYHNPEKRPLRITTGSPINEVIGLAPATVARTTPGGKVEAIPSFDEGPLANLSFEEGTPIQGDFMKPAAWSAQPLWRPGRGDELSVAAVAAESPLSRTGGHHLVIGYGLATGHGRGKVAQGGWVMIAQRIRNPRPGRYTFAIYASGDANGDQGHYQRVWSEQFSRRLVIYRYADSHKSINHIIEMASLPFDAPFAGPQTANYAKFEVSAVVKDQQDNAQHLDHGIGVAVIVAKTAPGVLDLAATGGHQALIRIDDAEIRFDPWTF